MNPLADLSKPDQKFLAMPATPGLVVKILLGFTISTLGVYYLGAGRKTQDVQKMLIGAALILAALMLF